MVKNSISIQNDFQWGNYFFFLPKFQLQLKVDFFFLFRFKLNWALDQVIPKYTAWTLNNEKNANVMHTNMVPNSKNSTYGCEKNKCVSGWISFEWKIG